MIDGKRSVYHSASFARKITRVLLVLVLAYSTTIATAADAWHGTPPPTPGNFLRETEAYRGWCKAFYAALPRLERKHYAAEAMALRQWYHQFTAAAAASARGELHTGTPTISPVFATRAVRRVIGPPPLPAYTTFHGYKVTLPWNGAVYYYRTDNIPLKSPYLLHANGIHDSGMPLRKRADIHALFARAGVTDTYAKNVLIKVSQLEGGFDAVNTWDTGYVSVGFLQFTTGETGEGHSLLHVLMRMKDTDPAQFTQFFSSHGIDVQEGHLAVHDPFSGKILTGAGAISLLIRDKRLIAIFQDAGAKSRAFQLAQIREAYGAYYLARSPIRIPVAEVCIYDPAAQKSHAIPETAKGTNTSGTAKVLGPVIQETAPQPVRTVYIYGQSAVRMAAMQASGRGNLSSRGGKQFRVVKRLPDLVGTIGDVLRSEGGKVTLTDRAVQHGVHNAIASFESGISYLSTDHPPTMKELSTHEDQLIAMLRNRIDVLAPTAKPRPAHRKK